MENAKTCSGITMEWLTSLKELRIEGIDNCNALWHSAFMSAQEKEETIFESRWGVGIGGRCAERV